MTKWQKTYMDKWQNEIKKLHPKIKKIKLSRTIFKKKNDKNEKHPKTKIVLPLYRPARTGIVRRRSPGRRVQSRWTRKSGWPREHGGGTGLHVPPETTGAGGTGYVQLKHKMKILKKYLWKIKIICETLESGNTGFPKQKYWNLETRRAWRCTRPGCVFHPRLPVPEGPEINIC